MDSIHHIKEHLVNKRNLIFAGAGTLVLLLALQHFGLLPAMRKVASSVPQVVDLSSGGDVTTSDTPFKGESVGGPSTKPASLNTPIVRVEQIPWNATMGWQFAVGGVQTMQGSLMEKYKVNIRLSRQDDVEKMKANQLLFATNLAQGQAHPSTGTHFVIIMGDGGAQYITSLNSAIDNADLGPEYHAEVIGSLGYSRGEDACFGPQEWKDNPAAAKGGVAAAYLRDGDWNLMQFWLAQNGIKNNPDETTYDPDALNWVATDDFLKAVETYVGGHTEERPVVINGKLNGKKQTVSVNAVCTWTPGDVALAKGRGGLVRLISTKENAYQMPATLVGIKKWDASNSQLVQNMLRAAFDGSDQVKHFDAALQLAGRISYNVYADQSPAYWVKYFKGSRERDKAGQMVELGGSTTSNLADNLVLFGLAGGAGGGIKSSIYNATYTGFGNITKQQYPKLFPEFVPVESAVNTSYIASLAASLKPREEEAEVVTFNEEATRIEASNVVAKRNWSIQFETGKATFTPQAEATLSELYNQLLVGGALAVQIEGHTDNVGNPDANLLLSRRRADAVRAYLQQRAPRLFATGRVNTIAYGDSQPVAGNSTEAGRAQNRRVTIVLGVQQ